MSKLCFVLIFIFGLFLGLYSDVVLAQKEVNSLINNDHLTVELTINHDQQHIVGQAVVISIEVATNRWFAKGSNVQSFTLPDMVMQANNITTINGSKRINGTTWATQLHEITFYPTKPGRYLIPEIPIYVSVNTETEGIVSGLLRTKEDTIDITLPEALMGIDHFIVSSDVTVSIEGKFDVNKAYSVGEALTQTIIIVANDTPAMMIPEINSVDNTKLKVSDRINSNQSGNHFLDGISIYHKPAQIVDKSNRGNLTGTRIESLTYIFEKPGNYVLPEQKIHWWNTQTNTLEEILIPSSTWTVSGASFIEKSQSLFKDTDFGLNIYSLIIVTTSIISLVLTYLIFRSRHQIMLFYKKITHYHQRQLRQQFLNCIANKEYLNATQFLYQYALGNDKADEINGWELTKNLNLLTFKAVQEETILPCFSVHDGKTLIRKIDSYVGDNKNSLNFPPNQPIKLNRE